MTDRTDLAAPRGKEDDEGSMTSYADEGVGDTGVAAGRAAQGRSSNPAATTTITLAGRRLPALRYADWDNPDDPGGAIIDPSWRWSAVLPLGESGLMASVCATSDGVYVLRHRDRKVGSVIPWREIEEGRHATEQAAYDQIVAWSRAS